MEEQWASLAGGEPCSEVSGAAAQLEVTKKKQD
jgi:hypothetical protein